MAATVIDSLLITLGLDAREYQKGSKDAQDALGKFGAESDKQSKLVGMQSKAIAQGFAQVRNEIIGLVAVAMGASTVKDFFAGMVQGQAHLGRLATNLGMSARALDAWDAAVETVGGSAQGLNASLQNIQAGFEAFKLGEDSPVVQAFRALGINIADANGQVRPMKDLLLDLSAALKGMKPQDQIKVAQMLGLDEGTLNLLREGNVQVKALVDHFEETSGVTDASVESAKKAQAAWATFNRELKGVGQTIFEMLTPSLEAMNAQLLNASAWVSAHKSDIADFFNGAAVAARFFGRALADTWHLFDESGNRLDRFLARQVGGKGSLGEALADTQLGRWLGGVAASAMDYAGAGESRGNASTGAGSMFGRLEKQYGLPEGTMDRIWNMESSRGKNMVSPKGATGHFQFMEGTAKQYGLSRADTFDLGKSAEAAAHYLSDLRRQFGGDMSQAVAAYNWGPGNLSRFGMNGAPKETQDYLSKFSGQSSHSETHIGTINIQTKATDAPGIASSISGAISQTSRQMSVITGVSP